MDCGINQIHAGSVAEKQINAGSVAINIRLKNCANMTSITHKFLIKGHIQNEGDWVYSVIQHTITRALKLSPIYVPDQYHSLIKTAKKTGKPYTEELTHDNYFDLKPLCAGNYNINYGNKFKWTDIEILKADKVSNGILFFKTSNNMKRRIQVGIYVIKRTKSKAVPDCNLTLNQLYTEKLTAPETKSKANFNAIPKTMSCQDFMYLFILISKLVH